MTSLRMKMVLVFCLLLAASVSNAQARTLHWQSLDVQARLDAAGALHVTERHAMVFDGDWNGGERTFQLRAWHRLSVHSIAELAADGSARTELAKGDLRSTNTYKLIDGNVLRWRSRLPSDPPFHETAKIYEIAYTLEGALVRQGEEYVLEHDLAFPNRDGEIERFDATLDIDPAWQAQGVPHTFHHDHLLPGQSVFVTARLRHVGVEEPAAVARPGWFGSIQELPAAPDWLRYASFFLVIGFAIGSTVRLVRHERSMGRFEPATPVERVDEAWLQDNVFKLPAEVVGAAWDRKTAAAEVAALIARLTLEGKLASEARLKGSWVFRHEVLYLTLKCEREAFVSYERKLIDKLFFDERRETDTDSIRAHYKAKGFNPSRLIRSGVERRLPRGFRNSQPLPRWRLWFTAGALLLGAALAALGSRRSPEAIVHGAVALLVMVVLFVVGAFRSYSFSSNVNGLIGRLFGALISPALLGLMMYFLLLAGVYTFTAPEVIALVMICAGVLNSLVNRMYSRESGDAMIVRRALGTARAYFQRELASEQPRLKDEWFPYLIALDLSPNITRWFKAFGSDAARRTGVSSASSSSTSHAGIVSSTWSGGGGGTFGGAGASSSWAAAVSGLAAGVAAPSSSGSSGGSSSSSGGGGGGGW